MEGGDAMMRPEIGMQNCYLLNRLDPVQDSHGVEGGGNFYPCGF